MRCSRLLVALSSLALGCAGEPVTAEGDDGGERCVGAVGCQCTAVGGCDFSLRCESGTCVERRERVSTTDAGEAGGSEPDAGCGSSRLVCPPKTRCDGDACVPVSSCETDGGCGDGAVCCDGACLDADASTVNCGGCGIVCAPGESCAAGTCVAPGCGVAGCPRDQFCNEDPPGVFSCRCGANPGCGPGLNCLGGYCLCDTTECGATSACCNRLCVDVLDDQSNCGGCGVVCPPGTACAEGTCG